MRIPFFALYFSDNNENSVKNILRAAHLTAIIKKELIRFLNWIKKIITSITKQQQQ